MGSDPTQVDLHHLDGYVRPATMKDRDDLQRYFESLDQGRRAARFDGETSAAKFMAIWLSPDHLGLVAILRRSNKTVGELHAHADQPGHEEVRFSAEPGPGSGGVQAKLLWVHADMARRRGTQHLTVRGISHKDATARGIVVAQGFTAVWTDGEREEFRFAL